MEYDQAEQFLRDARICDVVDIAWKEGLVAKTGHEMTGFIAELSTNPCAVSLTKSHPMRDPPKTELGYTDVLLLDAIRYRIHKEDRSYFFNG